MSVSERCCWDLTDMTLADENANSIPTDIANRAIEGNVSMPWHVLVESSGGTRFLTNASFATWWRHWPNLQLVQLASSGGQIFNLCKWPCSKFVNELLNPPGPSEKYLISIYQMGIFKAPIQAQMLQTAGPFGRCLWCPLRPRIHIFGALAHNIT